MKWNTMLSDDGKHRIIAEWEDEKIINIHFELRKTDVYGNAYYVRVKEYDRQYNIMFNVFYAMAKEKKDGK